MIGVATLVSSKDIDPLTYSTVSIILMKRPMHVLRLFP